MDLSIAIMTQNEEICIWKIFHHHRWMKKYQLGNVGSRRVGLLQFIEKQYERTRARMSANQPSCAKVAKSTFSGSSEVWRRKPIRDRVPKYLGSHNMSKLTKEVKLTLSFQYITSVMLSHCIRLFHLRPTIVCHEYILTSMWIWSNYESIKCMSCICITNIGPELLFIKGTDKRNFWLF